MHLAEPQENVFLRGGDVLTLVREPQTFTTFGAIGQNTVVPFGRITLSLEEAVAKAGGLIDSKSDPNGVFLLRFEPPAALISGPDGLNDIRVIVGDAAQHLLPGGWLLFEHGYDQAESCRDLLAKAGFGELKSWTDLANIARVAGGRLLTPNSATR